MLHIRFPGFISFMTGLLYFLTTITHFTQYYYSTVISEYKANIPDEIGQSLNKIHCFILLKLIFSYQETYPSTNLLGTLSESHP